MTLIGSIGITIWLVCLVLTLYGTRLFKKHFSRPPRYMDAPFKLYPISIIKPLKGLDPGLEKNLESFFELRYPEFELLFCVSDESDPALPVVRKIISVYPRVKAKVLIGEEKIGFNPKVNNIVRAYEQAKHDWILISDSNTIVPANYLKRLVGCLDSSVGVLTSVVSISDTTSFAGAMESSYMNTFYARWMLIAHKLRKPCVIGKSMIFRKSAADRFGGMRNLSSYIAEDYMTGHAMQMLGLNVEISHDPIRQPLSKYTVADFISRHIRWARIRKSHAPLLFALEPLTGALFPSLLGLFGFYFYTGQFYWSIFIAHFLIHFLSDLKIALQLETKINLKWIGAWYFREIFMPSLLVGAWLSNKIKWRGHDLVIQPGGIVRDIMDQPNGTN